MSLIRYSTYLSAKNGGTELALVLDEYNLVEDPAIHRSLNYLLTHRRHNLHPVIASRTEPARDWPSYAPRARWRS